MIALTGRHLVQQNGLYDSVEDEAAELGLVGATAGRPAPGPAERDLDAIAAMRRRWLEQAAPPTAGRRWPELDVEQRSAWWREVDEADARAQEVDDAART